jgi:hypothetical protein
MLPTSTAKLRSPILTVYFIGRVLAG